MSDSLWRYGQQPSRLLSPWDSPGKDTGVCCHALLQGIFPTQWLNPCLLQLLHYRRILYLFHIIWKPLKLVIIGFFFFTTNPYYYPISLFVIEFTRFTTIHTNIIWWALLFVPLSFLLRSVPSYSRIPFSIPPSKSKLLWAGNSLFFLKNKLAVILEW